MADFNDESYLVGEKFDSNNNRSIDNYTNSVKDNTIKYFLDSNGNLNIIVDLSIPAGRRTGHYTIIKL